MRFKTLWLTLFLQFGIVLVFFGVLVTLAQQIFLTTVQLNRSKDLLSNAAKNIVREIQINNITVTEIESGENERLNNILIREAVTQYVQIFIYKSDEIYYPSTNTDISASNNKEQGKDDYGIFYEKKSDDENSNVTYLVYIRDIFPSYGHKLEIRTHLTTIQQSVDLTNIFTRIVSVAAILLSLVWAFTFSRIFVRPIVNMNKITHELANLKFGSKLEIDRTDELGQLAENINLMSYKLKNAMEELKIKNEQLTRELEREKGLDTMRKKFVSDVSHELKTPLSIISGYAESLKASINQSSSKRGQYCEVIMDETAKMTKLVHDLLNLSQYTSGTFNIEISDFYIDELVKSVAERYSSMIEQNNITLEIHLEHNLVKADPLRIEQVINNYLNNAISHNDENRQLVIIGKIIEGNYYRVSVFNSGEHIADEDLTKIWGAFYKVDKARSRNNGRYGIGLSIVKAIMDLHGGRIGVNNVPNGVEFYFDILLKK